MQVSAEIRWFWKESLPAGLEEWFQSKDVHRCAAGGGDTRTDEYLREPPRDTVQAELGVKRRGGKDGVEVKGLVSVVQDGVVAGPFAGPIEIWSKWSTQSLHVQDVVSTEKLRWLRKFDTGGDTPAEVPLGSDEKPVDKDRPLPERGCNVELTRVTCAGKVWWTLGFESFGALQDVENSLRATATLLGTRRPPVLGDDALRASYPAWLARPVA